MLKTNDFVIVPEPEEGDYWNHSFIGRVVTVNNEEVLVIDQDDDVFTVSIDRLVLKSEE